MSMPLWSSTVPGGAGGLYRKQSPVQGRWRSPDPAGLAARNPADPQTWNRYAYVGNRPLNNVDPLGMFSGGDPGHPCDPIFGDCECPFGEMCPIDPPNPIDPIGGGGVIVTTVGAPRERTGGVWPNDRTLGLPTGLGNSPFNLGNLLGLSPGTQCGDFVTCGSLGPGTGFDPFSFQSGATIAVPKPIPLPWWQTIALDVFLILLGETGDNQGCAYRPDAPGCNSGKQARCTLQRTNIELGLCEYSCEDGVPHATSGPPCAPVVYKDWGK